MSYTRNIPPGVKLGLGGCFKKGDGGYEDQDEEGETALNIKHLSIV